MLTESLNWVAGGRCTYRLSFLSECKIEQNNMGGLWSKDETGRDESGKSKKRKKGQHGGPLVKAQVLASPVVWKRTR